MCGKGLLDLRAEMFQGLVLVTVPGVEVGVGVDGLITGVDAVHHMQGRPEPEGKIRRRAQCGQAGCLVVEPDHQRRYLA